MPAMQVDLGLQQKEAAEKLGMAVATVYNSENSQTIPAIRFAHNIWKTLAMDIVEPTSIPYAPSSSNIATLTK